MRRFLSFVLLLVTTFAAAPCFGAVPAELQPLTFLLGEWAANGSGAPGEAGGRTVFSTSLQDRVLLRTNFAAYPETKDKPASRHDDLMVIYAAQGGGVLADYYDSEGHVIQYDVTAPEIGTALFVSRAVDGTPRYRLTYRLGSDGLLSGEFAISPTGKPDAYKPYLTWVSRKAK